MLGWLIRTLLVISGFIASFFVARTELHFEVVQMSITVILFTFAVWVIAFWPTIKAWFQRR